MTAVPSLPADPPKSYLAGVRPLALRLSALGFAAFGLWMLVGPLDWYRSVPGAADSGPFNPHFVRDVGIGYLAMGLALGLAARLPAAAFPLALLVAVESLLHAGLHAGEHLARGHMLAAGEAAGVFGQAALAAGLAWWLRPRARR